MYRVMSGINKFSKKVSALRVLLRDLTKNNLCSKKQKITPSSTLVCMKGAHIVACVVASPGLHTACWHWMNSYLYHTWYALIGQCCQMTWHGRYRKLAVHYSFLGSLTAFAVRSMSGANGVCVLTGVIYRWTSASIWFIHMTLNFASFVYLQYKIITNERCEIQNRTRW